MPMKRYKPEQIVNLLRQIELEIANGKTTPQACKEAEITVQSYYRWRKEYGGLKLDQAKRLKELERENAKQKRLRPEGANHVWSYDFVSAMTHDGRTLRLLVLIDEYTRECLAIRVARRLGSNEVIDTLAEVMLWRGIPEHIRSDNGPEFVAKELRKWLASVETGTLYIEPGSPWESGYCESFNGKMRTNRSGELSPFARKSASRVGRYRCVVQSSKSSAPFRTNSSRYLGLLSRKRFRSRPYLVSMSPKSSFRSRARLSSFCRIEAGMLLSFGSRN